eukprot:403528-Prymnesium_polylepis.1
MSLSKTARVTFEDCTYRARPCNFVEERTNETRLESSVNVSVDLLREVCRQVCRRAARTPRE